MKDKILIALILLLCGANAALSQTTEFTFQSKLVDGSIPANASYDFEFRLFGTETGGAPIAANQRLGVAVSNGIFTVKLDFGGNFNGPPRWLEIAVKPAGGGALTTLNPRQPMTGVPYAIRSLNSANADNAVNATNAATAANSQQLGGVAANQFVITTDTRLFDARNPLPGSPNYIQNTSLLQNGDFNIDGDARASVFSAAAEFQIGGQRILGATGSANTIAGIGAGTSSTGDSNSFFGRSAGGGSTNSGSSNSFFGERSGALNTTGFGNSFFGAASGVTNTTGRTNSFFGVQTGQSNTTGFDNSFFGVQAGFGNTTGIGNSFFGRGAGTTNSNGNENSFFGFEAGLNNTAGGNSFFGANAGRANTTGLANSFFGRRAGSLNTTDDNSFFGANAGAVTTTGGNNSFFGSAAGTSNTTGNANSFFGERAGEDNTTGGRNTFLGRWSGTSNTTGGDNTFVGFNSGLNNNTGTKNVFVGLFAGGLNATGDNLTLIGSNTDVPNGSSLQYATAIGADALVSTSNTVQLGRQNGFDTVRVSGLLILGGLGVAGSTDVCRNASNQLSTCSSSLRYKSNVQKFTGGLNIVRQLRPITFNWRGGELKDVGFAAEEVAGLEPLLTTTNGNGQIEGVKYAQISTVLVNAVNEQQTQIEEQQKQIESQNKLLIEQQRQIDALKKLVCASNPNSEICREEEQP